MHLVRFAGRKNEKPRKKKTDCNHPRSRTTKHETNEARNERTPREEEPLLLPAENELFEKGGEGGSRRRWIRRNVDVASWNATEKGAYKGRKREGRGEACVE